MGAYLFDSISTNRFLDKHGLKCVVRAHEMKLGGFDVVHSGRCVTIFSSAKYMGCENKGAIARVSFHNVLSENDDV
jgi:serine/threonine-protein phosphatase 5